MGSNRIAVVLAVALAGTACAKDVDAGVPEALIVFPGAGCRNEIYTKVPTRMLGRDSRPTRLPFTCSWTSSRITDLASSVSRQIQDSNRGCELNAVFPTPGRRTIALTMTSPAGVSSKTEVEIEVKDPPPGSIPVLAPPGPASCEAIRLDVADGAKAKTTVHLRQFGADAVRVDWTWKAGDCPAVPLPVHQHLDRLCVPGYGPCTSFHDIVGSEVLKVTAQGCGGPSASGTVRIAATSVGGAVNSTELTVQLDGGPTATAAAATVLR